MGLFSYFRDRRAKESALPDSDLNAELSAASPDAVSIQNAQVQSVEVQGIDDLGDLFDVGRMVQQAIAQGNAQVESQVIDLRGSGAREEIMGALAKHGWDATDSSGSFDEANAAALQQEIFAALARAGVDLEAAGIPTELQPGTAASTEPAEPIDPSVPQIRNPLDPR